MTTANFVDLVLVTLFCVTVSACEKVSETAEIADGGPIPTCDAPACPPETDAALIDVPGDALEENGEMPDGNVPDTGDASDGDGKARPCPNVGCLDAGQVPDGPTGDGSVDATRDGTTAPDGATDTSTDVDLDASSDGDARSDGGNVDAPPTVCDPMTYGAKRDGKTKDTVAIQKAIDFCASLGGGTVQLQGGSFLSGMIVLKSNIVLDIAAGATLRGSSDVVDYPDTNPPTNNSQTGNCKKALVYAEQANDVRIEGGGTIDGVLSANWDGKEEKLRPMAIYTALSTDVTIRNITVKNAAMWAVVNLEVVRLSILSVTVDSTAGATRDGIDVVDGQDVLIQDSTVTSGDDSICLKSGSGKGLHNVLVKNCTIKGSGVANGLKFGTATTGPIENITFEDISITNSQAAAIAVESVDGSRISNVAFRRITATNVGTPFFILLGTRRSDGLVGSIRGIAFEDISASGLKYPWGSLVSGSPANAAGTHAVADVSFTNIKISFKGKGTATGAHYYGTADLDSFPEYAQGYPDPKFLFATPTDKQEVVDYSLPAWGFFVRHAENVAFADCAKVTVTGTDDRKWLATKDATVTGACGP